ncbi:MAG: 2Fe-2S iron-sulfur cluster binding domain-containing protein [Desulfobacteraceae bacterium]|nr:2Fe-2S iron-sulfur cluster binding domain-containing protein [Desulfobacteraceae bacterium]
MPVITIDGEPYEVNAGDSVLETARSHHIDIPTLCYHPALKPSGSCRLCTVEVAGRASGKPVAMLSCILKARDGLVVKTRGKIVGAARRKAFLRLSQMAPQSGSIIMLAKAHGVDLGAPPDGCIRCRLCIRVCKEIVGPGALKMEKRDGTDYVVPLESLCIGCGTCANICPTKAIRVADDGNVRTVSIRDEVIGRHPLEICEGCGKPFATPRFLEHIHSRTTHHPDVKTHHRYCPTCTKLFSDRIQTARDHTRK